MDVGQPTVDQLRLFLAVAEEQAELVDGGLADVHYSTPSNISSGFIRVFTNVRKRHLGPNIDSNEGYDP